MLRTALALLFSLSAVTIASPAWSQDYPRGPVRLIQTTSVGSGPDIVNRVFADQLSKIWGHPVIVESRTGANGLIAINALKSSPSDGTSLLVLDNAAATVNPYLYKDMDFDAERDLTALTPIMSTSFYLATSADSRFKTVQDVIAFAKSNPGKLTYGSPTGVGHPSHLGMEVLKAHYGVDIALAPYKSAGAMLTDLTTGLLDLGWVSYGSGIASLQSGKIRFLAVAAKARQAGQPNVPTIAESGGPVGFDINGWTALFGPKQLPAAIAAKIIKDGSQAMQHPDVQTRVTSAYNDPLTGGASVIQEMLRSDTTKYRDVIQRLGLKM